MHEVATAIKNKERNLAEINRLPYKSVFSDGGIVDALSVLFRNKIIAELQDYIVAPARDLAKARGQKWRG